MAPVKPAIAKIVGQAASLKAEVRLVGAIAAFAQVLDEEERKRFTELRSQPPAARDFFELTRQLNDDGARKHRAWKPYGARLVRFLEGIQLLSKVGDVVVGGAQNLLASGVWASVRLSLQVSYLVHAHLKEYIPLVQDCVLNIIGRLSLATSHTLRRYQKHL